MSIETLNSAARAAGFAMAASDESEEERRPEERSEDNSWRPGEAVLLKQAEIGPATDAPAKAASSFTDWVKGVVSAVGRRAPA